MKTVKLRGVEVGAGMPKVIVPIVAATRAGILEKAREFKDHALDVVAWIFTRTFLRPGRC